MDASRIMPRGTGDSSARRMLTGMAALALAALGASLDARAFFAAWLIAWWTCASVILGGQANLWMHGITGGAWAQPLRPVWQACARRMPLLLLLMLPLLLSPWALYPWGEPGWHPESSASGFKALWLTPWFFDLRLLVYGAVWTALSVLPTDRTPPRKGLSALALLAYGLSVSLAGVDLLMSLLPEWYASGFGLLLIVMQMKFAFAYAMWRGIGTAPLPPQRGRDLGNLLLMYVLMWAYLAFVQFLIIWAENLPHEIAWYVPRLQTGWVWLAVLLPVAGFFIPLLLLLFRAFKQNAGRLRKLSAGLCLMGYAESVWLVLPSVDQPGWQVIWMAPLAMAGMAALIWPGGASDG